MELPLQKSLFQLSSQLTDRMPRAGARLLDALLIPILTSPGMEKRFESRNDRALEQAGRLDRILVLADIHLGDAVMMQAAISALRDYLPDAEIHYVVSSAAARLVENNPEISKLWPLYTGGALPSPSDLQAVDTLCRDGGFDLVVNTSGFFGHGNPIPRTLPMLDLTTHAPHLFRNETTFAEPNHFLYQVHVFLHQVLGRRFRPVRRERVRGVSLVLRDAAHLDAAAFLRRLGWPAGDPVVLINPDTASPFTRPGFELLAGLVAQLAARPLRVLVGEGHTDKGVGARLLRTLSARAARRVRLVPASLKVEAYAALTDLADVFVSGDTGPLHWAAARKQFMSGRSLCRNRTMVVSLFGATPARMSGYDSCQPGFLAAWQDAPSITFISAPPCRNVTCLNKLHKTCREARCFEGLQPLPIALAIGRHLDEVWPRRDDRRPAYAEAPIPLPA